MTSLSSPAPLFWELIPYDAQASASARPRKGCVGHFFDEKTRREVTVYLGTVWCRPVPGFRSAPSPVVAYDDEPANVLSWAFEGADQSSAESCSVSTTATNSHN